MAQKQFAVAIYDGTGLYLEFLHARNEREAVKDSEKFCELCSDREDEPETIPNVPFPLEGIKRVLWDDLEWEVEIKEIPQ